MPPLRTTPLSWNEIRDRAVQFSREWEGVSSEDAEAKSFLTTKSVHAAYGKRQFATEAERVAYLFEEYQKLTAPLMEVGGKKKKKAA